MDAVTQSDLCELQGRSCEGVVTIGPTVSLPWLRIPEQMELPYL